MRVAELSKYSDSWIISNPDVLETDMTPLSPPLSLFVLVRALPAWLALSRAERRQIGGAALATLPEGLTFRQFDTEAFSAMCSDIWMIEGATPRSINTAMERLRDTPLFSVPYFEFVAILPALEDGWQAFEAEEAGV
ncbi:darcynin family protein [Seohaeicola nanhaiensis]|uniref:Darcynin family protein n=1 Tax=Seohaeicola nanhaiensis TaxID=1387282 RepID=A0ABV9KBK8_9RHOB